MTIAPAKPTKASKAYFKIYQHYAAMIQLFGNPDCAPDPAELRDYLQKLEALAVQARGHYMKDEKGMLTFPEGDEWPVDFTTPYWQGKSEKHRVEQDLFETSFAAALGWDDYDLIPEGPLLSIDWTSLEDRPRLYLECVFHKHDSSTARRLVTDEYRDIIVAPRMIQLKL